MRRGDSGLLGQTQCNFLPGFNAVFVGLFWEFRNRQVTMLVDYRGFGARTAERGSGGKDELEVLVGFLVTYDAFGTLARESPGLRVGPVGVLNVA